VGVYGVAQNRVAADLRKKTKLEEQYRKHIEEIQAKYHEQVELTEVQQLLSAVSDQNTMETLDFVTGVINRTLAEMFTSDVRSISLEKKLHGGKYPHVNVQLVDGSGAKRDLVVQSGTGLRQVVSFLYTVCLIQLTGQRKLLISDEILSGLHVDAKKTIEEVIEVLSKDMQFVMVEYHMNTVGRLYNVEKRGKVARVVPIEGEYTNQVFVTADDSELVEV
jgi:hypothetical protein